jgi:plastocyanin
VRLPTCLLALALPVVIAACGGGGGGSTTTQAASSEPCASGAVTIHMKNLKFNPDTATAKVGDKVCWVNDDDVQHDAVDESGGRFTSALYGNGMTFTWTADKAGTVSYVCTVHPGMTGELTVQ